MPKMNIKVSIKNEAENQNYSVPAIIKEEKIHYRENQDTKVQFDYRENTLFRENKDFKMTYRFDLKKDTTGIISMKELNKNIELVIKTKKIERNNLNIEIEFQVEGKDFLYKIEEVK